MIKNIKLVVSDFDGVMTDNTALIDENGREYVRVSRADGQGINLLKAQGIDVVILSSEANPVVTARANKLKIKCFQGIKNKAEALKLICDSQQVSFDEIAYIGNDVNDYEAMMLAKTKIVPADAYGEVKSIADYITDAKGGYGVIREVANWILKK